MNTFHIELLADVNRNTIAVYCPEFVQQNIRTKINKEEILNQFNPNAMFRVVYSEEFTSMEKTIERYLELKNLSVILKKRLIKKQNPNWRCIRFLKLN